MATIKRIYLDYAATTPLDRRVEEAMRPYFGVVNARGLDRKTPLFGNPGSMHWFGQQASAAVFKARQAIAAALGAEYKEIIFTGSATEANNLAIRGVLDFMFRKQNNLFIQRPLKLIMSSIEHDSVLKTARDLQKGDIEIAVIPVNSDGIVDLKKLEAALDERTVLISVQYANSEIGVIQPIKKISELIKNYKYHVQNHSLLFHVDAVQAFQFLKCNVNELGVDLLTLSAHKIYGPKGIGALYVRSFESNRPFLSPLITGGEQEFGLRSGTENVPAIIGFGRAVEITERVRLRESNRLLVLRDRLLSGITRIVPDAVVNGSLEFRLPNNLNIYFPGRSAQDLCIEFDIMGFAISPGVACASRAIGRSYVIDALGGSRDRASSSIRFSLGRPTVVSEVRALLTALQKRFK